jgi:two-component system sensor histidine kinase/response regulator
MVAAFTALAVVDRIVALDRRLVRGLWHTLGAAAMGLGIWAMHFTAMLAFQLPVPVSYDSTITFVSLIPAIVGSGVAIRFLSQGTASRWRAPVGGVPVVLAIGLMHFAGMEAMQMNARLVYRPGVFALSLAVCYVLAVLALDTRPRLDRLIRRPQLSRALAAVIVGLAVTGMHHTAMWASVFVPMPAATAIRPGIDSSLLALLVSVGSTMVVGLTLVAAIVDQRLARAAESVFATETRYRTVLESMSDAVLTFDESGQIGSANRAVADCFDYEPATLIGGDFGSLIPELPDLPVGTDSVRMSTSGVRRDGSRFPLELTLAPMTINRQPLTSAVARDITDQVQRDAEIQQHIGRLEELSESLRARSAEAARERDRAEALAQAKSDFLAAMSHEIRTPMNGVIGVADLLMESDLTPEQREQVEIIRSSGQALLQVINEILDFSKLDAGRVTLEPVGFDLLDVLRGVRKLLASEAERKGIGLVVQADRVLPRLMGDPFRLRQVVLNLVSNAIKFTERGGVAIHVDAAPDGGAWRIRMTVEDSGIGIDQATQQRLFTPFSQADVSTTRKYGGTGLGLAISKRLVEMMGGTIGLESAPGIGSKFLVDLSLPAESLASAAPAAPAQALGVYPMPHQTLRVLVAEDNRTNQRVAELLLSKIGWQPVIASTGVEAVHAWREGSFDLILMDCQMPEMDGFEATQVIRAEEPRGTHQPIVAITANAEDGARDRCLSAGMDDYVSKPLSKAALLEVLSRLTKKGLVAGREAATA